MAKTVTDTALRAAMEQAKTYMDKNDNAIKEEIESKLGEDSTYVTNEALEEKLAEYAKTESVELPTPLTGEELTAILNEVFQASEAV